MPTRVSAADCIFQLILLHKNCCTENDFCYYLAEEGKKEEMAMVLTFSALSLSLSLSSF